MTFSSFSGKMATNLFSHLELPLNTWCRQYSREIHTSCNDLRKCKSCFKKKNQTNLPSHTKTTELHGKVHGNAGITTSKMNLPSHNIWKVKLISSINRLPVFQGKVLPESDVISWSFLQLPHQRCNTEGQFLFFFNEKNCSAM